MAAAIKVENLTVEANGAVILDDVCVEVQAGLVTAIIGANGAGKTTLLKAMLGLIPYKGTIRLYCPAGSNRPRIGYVPQYLDFDRNIPITVADFLASSDQRFPLWFGVKPHSKKLALACLRRVQAEHLLSKPLGRLSGGEFQRVQLALALQSDPQILLLDEPVSGVDIQGGKLFCDILEDVHRKLGLTMVMVLHDLSVVTRHAQRVICLNKKLRCEGETPAVLTPENLAAVFGPHTGIYDHCANQPGHVHDHEHDHAHCGHAHHLQEPAPLP